MSPGLVGINVIEPVVIMMTPRSGSSLIARIFKRHGLYVGPYDLRPGYPSYENTQLKDALNRLCNCHSGLIRMRQMADDKGPDDVRQIVDEIMPHDKRWLFKTCIDAWQIWQGVYPDTRFVFVTRPVDSIVASAASKTHGNRNVIRDIVVARLEFMRDVAARHGVPIVKAEQVVAGNHASLAAAFDYCGIEFQPEIAAQCVDATMWRF